MPAASMTLTGGDALERKLKSMLPKAAKRVMRKALRAGAKPIRDASKQMVRVKTGSLQRHIKVYTGRSRKALIIRVGTKEGDYKGKHFYGSFLEWGTRRSRKFRFLKPALEQNQSRVMGIIEKEVRQGIEREAVKK